MMDGAGTEETVSVHILAKVYFSQTDSGVRCYQDSNRRRSHSANELVQKYWQELDLIMGSEEFQGSIITVIKRDKNNL